MTTALYRRYRPDSFSDVIGQDHVTEPLKAALRANRVTHAYLFSGPRGCGKTTSARIMARCLNCEQGPTDEPCGTCESCRELATGGPGSIDVVEIDAASHNGIDDARELRERATFAPARDRYKIFILDEAHMVTPAGFNALLKLVEEPPEHIKFIFATTEPDRVLGTIRSRTHHYPFRLVPSDVMVPYMAQLCEQERIKVDEGVLPLVARAGGGSVRDTLSVLDQLMAGTTDAHVTYPSTTALLGYTDAALLAETVEALGESDGARVFSTVERMIDAGHDPRRFVEDLLQRLRDLLIIAVAGEHAEALLVATAPDERSRMYDQARAWGARRLSRAADIADESLRQMVGATSPRLQLELMLGRILVEVSAIPASGVPAEAPVRPTEPAASAQQRVQPGGGVQPMSGAAMVREYMRSSQQPPAQPTQPAPSAQPTQPEPSALAPPAAKVPDAPEVPRREASIPTDSVDTASVDTASVREADGRDSAGYHSASHDSARDASTTATAVPTVSEATAEASIRNLFDHWDAFLEEVGSRRRASKVLMGANATIVSEDAASVTFGFANAALRNVFVNQGHADVIEESIEAVLGVRKSAQSVVGNSAETATAPTAPAPSSPAPSTPQSESQPQPRQPESHSLAAESPAEMSTEKPAHSPAEKPVEMPVASADEVSAEDLQTIAPHASVEMVSVNSGVTAAPHDETTPNLAAEETATSEMGTGETDDETSAVATGDDHADSSLDDNSADDDGDETAGASRDDVNVEMSTMMGVSVVERILGATVVDEFQREGK